MSKMMNFMLCLMLGGIWAGHSLAIDLEKDGVYKLSFADPDNYRERTFSNDEMLVRVKDILGAKSPFREALSRLKGVFGSKEVPLPETSPTYLFEILNIYRNESFFTTVVKEKIKPVKATGIALIGKGIRWFKDKTSKAAEPAFDALEIPPGEFYAFEVGKPFVADKASIDYYLSKTNPPVKVGTWKVGKLTALKDRSVDLLKLTKTKVDDLKEAIKTNLSGANDAVFKFGYRLGTEMGMPTAELSAKAVKAIVENIKISDASALVQMISGAPAKFSSIMPSDIKGLDFSKIYQASKSIGDIMPDINLVNVDFLKALADKIGVLGKIKFPTIPLFTEFDLPQLKIGLDDITTKLGKLSSGGSTIARSALEELNSLRSRLVLPDRDYKSSPENLLAFLQLKRAYEEAKILNEAEENAEAAIKELTMTIENASNTFVADLKTSFIQGIKSGIIADLSKNRIDLPEVSAAISAIRKTVADATAELKKGQAIAKGAADIYSTPAGIGSIPKSIDLIKNILGMGASGKEIGKTALSAQQAIIRVMIRGFN